jgi:hypothetical protein
LFKEYFGLSSCITILFLLSSIIVETIIETRRIFLNDIDDLSNLVIIVDYSYTHSGIYMWAFCAEEILMTALVPLRRNLHTFEARILERR